MRDLVLLLVHLIATVAKLLRSGGARSIVAESLLLKHQLLILNRPRARAPNLRSIDRLIVRCESLVLKTHWVMSVMDQRPSRRLLT
ncbi:MAG: hypothetical protein EHM84_04130 [Lysobacterales bacterium]|jgi:hypothetical protein|nr:MAG: hypothetical protein EHM84_04130 [Xanthomonadales bacterium]